MILKTTQEKKVILSRIKEIMYTNEDYYRMKWWTIQSGSIIYRGEVTDNGFLLQRNLKNSGRGAFHLLFVGDVYCNNQITYVAIKPKLNEGHILILLVLIPVLIYLVLSKQYLYFMISLLMTIGIALKHLLDYFHFVSVIRELIKDNS